MGRPFYSHEADDPDLDWLVTNFLYERSDYVPVENDMLPLVLIPFHEGEIVKQMIEEELPEPSELTSDKRNDQLRN